MVNLSPILLRPVISDGSVGPLKCLFPPYGTHSKEVKRERRIITSDNLIFGHDCGDSCVGVNGRCMEKHTKTQQINLVWPLMMECFSKWKNTSESRITHLPQKSYEVDMLGWSVFLHESPTDFNTAATTVWPKSKIQWCYELPFAKFLDTFPDTSNRKVQGSTCALLCLVAGENNLWVLIFKAFCKI